MTRKVYQFINCLSKLTQNRFQRQHSVIPFFFISTFPKSGSSFTELVLKELISCKRVSLNYSHLREQDLDEPKLIKYSGITTITKQHTLATLPNVELINKYEISPVIITRRLSDLILSLRQHISETLKWPFFYVPQYFNDLSIEQQFDLLVDFAIPWYFFFYASWRTTQEQNLANIKFTSYELFIEDQITYFQDILSFWNLSYSSAEISSAISKVNLLGRELTRHNKGTCPHKEMVLSQRNLDKINSYSKHYHEVDFTHIL